MSLTTYNLTSFQIGGNFTITPDLHYGKDSSGTVFEVNENSTGRMTWWLI